MKIMTFKEALSEANSYSKKHLLIGNGFSIACRPDIFVYSKLFDRANFSSLSPSARKVFNELKTEDFEKVIEALRDTRRVLKAYKDQGSYSKLRKLLNSDADGLREVLVQTIAASHPSAPMDLLESEYESCRTFLKPFDNVYSLNYDLLLYWVQMHTEEGKRPDSDDGFRNPDDEFETDYVTWESHQSHDQNTWYLHGALHVFDTGVEIQKYTWSRTGIRLVEQIRDALSKDYYPLFVAEGTSREKMARIRHSDFLSKAYRSFSEIGGALFVFGHSLAQNDEHYLKRIEQGKVQHLYVGIHGDPESKENRSIIKRALGMPQKRKRRTKLVVSFYDSETAHVWS